MSNALPKHNGNFSCLSYGTNVLIKLDNVDILQFQFEKFESRFRNNEHVVYDLKLAFFIIETFSKLWKLWTDFPELQDAIKKSKFYEVFAEMASFFQNEQNHCTIEKLQPVTKQKGSEQVINTTTAFEKPRRRPAVPHYVLLDEIYENDDCEPGQSLKSMKPFAVRVSDVPDVDEFSTIVDGRIPHRNANIEGMLKPSTLNDSTLSLNDVKNVLPNSEISLSSTCSYSPDISSTVRMDESSKEFFRLPSNKNRHCGPCYRTLDDDESIQEHLKNIKHEKQVKMMKESLYYLQRNKDIVILQNKRTMTFLCVACGKSQAGTNCLIQHCKSRAHWSNTKDMVSIETISDLGFSVPTGLP